MKKLLLNLFLSLSLLGATVLPNQVIGQQKPKKEVKKDVTFYVTKTGAKYQRYYCIYMRKSSIAMSKKSALSSGYSACSRCNP